jgi:hypothetical protein
MEGRQKRSIDQISGGSGNQNAGDLCSPNFSAVNKLMFIAYREEVLHMSYLEYEYEWNWVVHGYQMMNPLADPDEERTIPMIFDDDWSRSRYINRLLSWGRLDDAFECALRC